LYDPDQQRPAVAPLRVSIPAIKVRDAPIVGVGVVPEGDLEVPDGKTVGWYRFGSAPGEDGSTVLAAHVAFDGANGVFRYLTKLRAGDTIDVVDADGTDRSYSVSSVEQFPKTGLPADRVWRRDGPSQLVLLTCGGSFNSAIRHYEDNVVVFATPIT
jgi:LPXTG-site transpeptidase (sortase) family protein